MDSFDVQRPPLPDARLAAARERLGIDVPDDLLRDALRHDSAYRGLAPSQRELEFLGDGVVDLVASEVAFHVCRSQGAEAMDRLYESLTTNAAHRVVSEHLGLAEFIEVGGAVRGQPGGMGNGILAMTVEALIGAVHVTSGADRAREVLLSWWVRAGLVREAESST